MRANCADLEVIKLNLEIDFGQDIFNAYLAEMRFFERFTSLKRYYSFAKFLDHVYTSALNAHNYFGTICKQQIDSQIFIYKCTLCNYQSSIRI